MSDYYNRETGWDALCRIISEREKREEEELYEKQTSELRWEGKEE